MCPCADPKPQSDRLQPSSASLGFLIFILMRKIFISLHLRSVLLLSYLRNEETFHFRNEETLTKSHCLFLKFLLLLLLILLQPQYWNIIFPVVEHGHFAILSKVCED